MPEASEADRAGGGEDHARQEQGELEAPKEGGNRRGERVRPDGLGDHVNLASCDVSTELRGR